MANKEEADWFDSDIAEMPLEYGEKAGLQIYRNYTRSFEAHAIRLFVSALNEKPFETDDLQRFSSLVVREEPRYLPIITCAFADDLLVVAFKNAVPDYVPGGSSILFGPYGPLSSFAQRIQMAAAFDVVSPDLVLELDKVRSVRNKLSHSWDVSNLEALFTGGKLATIEPVESYLAEHGAFKERVGRLTDLGRLRMRLVWIACRLAYEAQAYHLAKKANLQPEKALYGQPASQWLRAVARVSLDASKEIMGEAPR